MLLSIALGGALGTSIRYAINVQTLTTLYPIGTVLENLLGSLLLGVVTGWALARAINPYIKAFLATGFCGTLTTMSTLAADTVFLAEDFSLTSSMTYVLLSVSGGLLLAFLGYAFGVGLAKSKRKEGEQT
nr:CrcB family protein [Texcoconibacillus texcoconensis]